MDSMRPAMIVDPMAEKTMAELGVSWRIETEIPLSSIDVKTSLRNQARLEPIDSDVVFQFAQDMEKGDIFPRLVLLKQPRGTYLVLGGNHRTAAAGLARWSTVDAYVVECEDPIILRFLSQSLNDHHGLRISTQDKLRQAADAVEQYGLTIEAAATKRGVQKGSLSAELRARSFDRRTTGFQFKRPVVKAIKERMDGIKLKPVFDAATALVRDASLTLNDVVELRHELDKTDTQQAQLEVVAKKRQQLQQTITRQRQGLTNPQKTRFMHAFTLFCKVVGDIESLIGPLTPDEIAQCKELYEPVNQKMWRMLAATDQATYQTSRKAEGNGAHMQSGKDISRRAVEGA